MLNLLRTAQLYTFCNVEIEEVAVESCLYTSSNYGDPIVEVFHVKPVNPVYDIEATVETEGKQVMRGYGLCFSRLGDHVQLRHDGHTLQVDRKRPQNLQS